MNTQRTNPRVFRVTTLLQQRKLPRSRSKLSRYIAERCGDAFERREREIVTAVEEFEDWDVRQHGGELKSNTHKRDYKVAYKVLVEGSDRDRIWARLLRF